MRCALAPVPWDDMQALQQSTVGNLLLRYCAEEDFARLQPHLERVHVQQGSSLFEPNKPIEQVFFPEGGVASIVAVQDGGDKIEVGLFGHEGMSGAVVILDAGQTPQSSMIQVNGANAIVIPSDVLAAACEQSSNLRRLLLRFVQAMNVQAASTAAANSQYALPERLARWLLMCHDRVDGDHIDLTHEFMGMMLGVRRSSVTVTLHTLEGTGAIRGTRGTISVTNRDTLEEIAGDGYGEAEAEYRRLIGPFGKGRHGIAAAG